jgi:hypothetical protein
METDYAQPPRPLMKEPQNKTPTIYVEIYLTK